MKVINLFKKGCLILTLICCVLRGSGQASTDQHNGIQIGQTLDPEYLKQAKAIRNGQQTWIQGGSSWLLLDFWETYCAACIASLPKLDSLQRRFADTVMFVPVTSKSWPLVHKVISRLPMGNPQSLNFIVEDTVLNKHFPHAEIPHVVWVDPKGVVRAITKGDQINESVISLLVSGKEVELARKQDNLQWDKNKPLGGIDPDETKPLYRSVLQKYNPANGSSTSFRSWNGQSNVGQKNHVYFSNARPIQMYYAAYMALTEGSGYSPNPYRISVEIKDTLVKARYANPDLSPMPFLASRFPFLEWKDKNAFREDNLFSYDLILEHPVPDSIFLEYVLSDLDRFFPIRGSVELRETECLVLTIQDTLKAKEALKPRGSKKRFRMDNTCIGIYNGTIAEFVKMHLSWFKSPPILDETGIRKPVDIEIFLTGSPRYNPANGLAINTPWDENFIKDELAKYGLTLQKGKRWVKILVIRDR